jgi:enoyl-CoA hydratase/carnithine racemase
MPSLRSTPFRGTGEQGLYVLDLGDGHNRFNEEFVSSLEGCLDAVEAAAPCALVTTARGKVFSNGLDLEWMATQGDAAIDFLARVQEMLARVLEIGVPTVAAMQGHTYAAGAMLALAHDQRVMRSDRGWFCLPEVDMGIPFTPGMTELLASRLPSGAVHEAIVLGRRYGGAEAAQEGIVEEAVSEAEVLSRACERAAALSGKPPETMRTIKQRLYASTLAALRGPLGFVSVPEAA